MSRTIGTVHRIKEVAMVNPRKGPTMAAKKKAPAKKAPARKQSSSTPTTPRRRRRRRHNPDMSLGAAFGGGFAGRVVTGVSRSAATMATAKHAKYGPAARAVASLVALGVAKVIVKEAPHVGFGMAGASGAATAEELGNMVGRGKAGKPPPAWARWIGVGNALQLSDGAEVFVDDTGKAFVQGALAAGMKELPAPQPVQMQGLMTFRALNGNNEQRMQAMAQLPSGCILVRDPRTGAFDELSGISWSELSGLVRMNGLVQLAPPPQPRGLVTENNGQLTRPAGSSSYNAS